MKTINLHLECTREEAEALQACANRMGHRDALDLAQSPEEAAQIMNGMYELREQISQQLEQQQ